MAVAVAPRRLPAPGRRLLAHDCRLATALVGGADEAGRGALAGPLVAAAVLFEPAALGTAARRSLRSLDDSKRCTQAVRERLLPCVLGAARRVTVILRGVPDVDAGGVHRANLAALAAAIDGLDAPEGASLLVDGFRLPALRRPHRAIVDGDATSAAIAAASIVAKVVRDRLMVAAAGAHPGYGFERHVGYATPEHLAALRRHGPCVLHRRSFAPCAQLMLAL